jgi:hypothetical protein
MRWQPLLAEIRAKKLALARLDPRSGMPVLPSAGASGRAIDLAARRLGRPLPPSYRELLALHDGLPGFYQGAALLGTRPLSRGTYVELARLSIDGGEGLVPFGIDGVGETIFAWDLGAVHHDGEMEVVVWMNEIGARVETFPAFLEMVLEMLRAEIDERKPRLSPPVSHRRPRVPEDLLEDDRFTAACA